jgi:hypothetical protein
MSNSTFDAGFVDRTGSGAASHTETDVEVDDRTLAHGIAFNRTPAFIPGDVDPTGQHALAWPLLDTGRADGGIGAETACLKLSTDLAVDAGTPGQFHEIAAVDAPASAESVPQVYYDNANVAHNLSLDELAHLTWRYDFATYLVFWTSSAPRLYSLLEQIQWKIDGQWGIAPDTTSALGYASTPSGIPLSAVITQMGYSATLPAVDAAGNALFEVRAPIAGKQDGRNDQH